MREASSSFMAQSAQEILCEVSTENEFLKLKQQKETTRWNMKHEVDRIAEKTGLLVCLSVCTFRPMYM